MRIKENLISAMVGITIWSILVVAVVVFFIYKQVLVGPVILALGFLILLSLSLFSRSVKSVWPDVIFGFIDNGALVVLALIGASLFGSLGAIVGGAVGNAITDGFAGIFKGHSAKSIKKRGVNHERCPVGTAFGKFAGCMIASGAILTIVWSVF